MKVHIPKIVSRVHSEEVEEDPYFHFIAEKTLQKILPENLFGENFTELEKEQFINLLPHLVFIKSSQFPGNHSFIVLAKYRFSAFKFFFEMISHWLVPGKRLNVILINGLDFKMPEIGDEEYTLCEIMIRIDDEHDLEQVINNFPSIEAEIKLGFGSSYYARKILETKGAAGDEKIAMVQEHIGSLIQKKSQNFDIDLLTEMQHLLLICQNEFKVKRTARQISKMITLHHLFRKALRKALSSNEKQRHLFVKLYPTKLHVHNNAHYNISIVIGINLLNAKELLEKKHIIQAVLETIPNAKLVENSFIVNKRSMEPLSLFYLEIEKSEDELISREEMQQLQKALPKSLTEHIEQLVYPVFMPRNEEEIMRNIINLSNQIRSQNDIPQVVITFDEQTGTHLIFTIVIVRVISPGGQSIEEMFKKTKTKIEFIHDRVKMVGLLRKKQIKEATVFRLKLDKNRFLRLNHSLDLYKARYEIASQIKMIIGEFRDFNGGMMIKQIELLHRFKDLLEDNVKYSELLLETFFFSLTPVAMQSILEPEALKILFLMLINAIDSGFPRNSRYRVRLDLDFIFLLAKADNTFDAEALKKALAKFNTHSTELAHMSIKVCDIRYEGYIYRCDEPIKQQEFLNEAEKAINRECLPECLLQTSSSA